MKNIPAKISLTLRSARHGRAGYATPARQGGVALVVALVLLLIISLLGIAAVRSTIMQQKMASNQYDRSVGFQSAEAALRVATVLVATHPDIIARNCQAGGVVCLSNPFEDPGVSPAAYQTVASGTDPGQFSASAAATGAPQFVIESMGNWANPSSSTGFGQSANSHNYGAQGASSSAVFYRVTARSGDPAKVGNRAVVTIQAIIKQG